MTTFSPFICCCDFALPVTMSVSTVLCLPLLVPGLASLLPLSESSSIEIEGPLQSNDINYLYYSRTELLDVAECF